MASVLFSGTYMPGYSFVPSIMFSFLRMIVAFPSQAMPGSDFILVVLYAS